MYDKITARSIEEFHKYLVNEEKSVATQQKYEKIITELGEYLQGYPISKELLLAYRSHLLEKNKIQTVNGKISAVNTFLEFLGLQKCRLKFLKTQKNVFAEERRELKESEYKQLLEAAGRKKNRRLYYLLLTMGATGIRVSELKYITVEALQNGKAEIRMKGKCRIIILNKKLTKRLQNFIREAGITSGCVFRTRSGNPLDRSNINHEMKQLCGEAGVNRWKVFPHNLRRLFARTFFRMEKNIAHLADILGHSSIEATRIYVATTVEMHEKILRKMSLII